MFLLRPLHRFPSCVREDVVAGSIRISNSGEKKVGLTVEVGRKMLLLSSDRKCSDASSFPIERPSEARGVCVRTRL